MERFKLIDFDVDVARCEIVKDGVVTSVEPRAMAVLAYLARFPKQVISQETLFEALWPNTVFSPGAVQRCIAQLRKALGDDARNARFIITHAKRGYSLDVTPELITKPAVFNKFALFTVAGVLLVVMTTLFFVWHSKPSASKPLGQLEPLTSSPHYDFYPTYSHDGQSFAFIRQTPATNQIIKLDTPSQQRTVLLETDYNVQSIAWGDDATHLYFMVRDATDDWVGKVHVDTKKMTRLFSNPNNGHFWRLFVKNDKVFYVSAEVPINQKPATQLAYYDLNTQRHFILLQSNEQFTPYRVAYLASSNTLAIAGESSANIVEFRLFDILSGKLSPPFATLPLGFTEISWFPSGEKLLVHHLNKLYSLNLTGKLVPLPYTGYERMFNPVVSPITGDIVMSVTRLDSDLVIYNTETEQTQVIVDSDGEDHLARFSPESDAIAYVSSRSGRQQVYVTESGQDRMIFDNPNNLPIYRAPVWSKSGEHIVFAFGNELMLYSDQLKKLIKQPMRPSFTAVLDWYSDGDHLLISTKVDNQSYFERLHIATGEQTRLVTSGVNFSARLDEYDNLVFVKGDRVHATNSPFNGMKLNTDQVIPMSQQLVYHQMGFLTKHNERSTRQFSIPESLTSLEDARDGNRFLFVRQTRQSANLIVLK